MRGSWLILYWPLQGRIGTSLAWPNLMAKFGFVPGRDNIFEKSLSMTSCRRDFVSSYVGGFTWKEFVTLSSYSVKISQYLHLSPLAALQPSLILSFDLHCSALWRLLPPAVAAGLNLVRGCPPTSSGKTCARSQLRRLERLREGGFGHCERLRDECRRPLPTVDESNLLQIYSPVHTNYSGLYQQSTRITLTISATNSNLLHFLTNMFHISLWSGCCV